MWYLSSRKLPNKLLAILRDQKTVRFRRYWRLLPAVLAVGCAKYEPKPLTQPAIEQTLATPDAHALRVRVSEIHHPLLKPVPIELARGLTPDSAAVLAVVMNPQLRA